MQIMIVTKTTDPLLVISMCARTCYNSRKLDRDRIRKSFVKGLIKSGHESPLENASVCFDIRGVSRALLAQITRHRIASFCVESQRYVKYDNIWSAGETYIIPDSVHKSRVIFSEYIFLFNKINKLYRRMLKNGIKPEDARMILPQAFTTNLTVTMNVRELRHFFKLRLDKHAQWEIRELASKMFDILNETDYAVFFEDIKVKNNTAYNKA